MREQFLDHPAGAGDALPVAPVSVHTRVQRHRQSGPGGLQILSLVLDTAMRMHGLTMSWNSPGSFQLPACAEKTAIVWLHPLKTSHLGRPCLAQPRADRLTKCFSFQLQLFNAVKYSTAFPVIIFSAMKYQVSREAWVGLYKPLWLGAALLNSGYSYFWDVERDWEIQFFTSPGALTFIPLKSLETCLDWMGSQHPNNEPPESMLSNMCTCQL